MSSTVLIKLGTYGHPDIYIEQEVSDRTSQLIIKDIRSIVIKSLRRGMNVVEVLDGMEEIEHVERPERDNCGPRGTRTYMVRRQM